MADTLNPKARSERMSRVKGKHTGPEMYVRRMVYALGFRYRLHGRNLPGRPDLVFRGRRKVIFVHGCFWHRHKHRSCKLARLPKSRLDFWLPKLDMNRVRDLKNQRKLKSKGWKYLILWECELNDQAFLEKKISAFLTP